MAYDFDTITDRRHTDCIKWDAYGDDVLPMWVADMDFQAPEPVMQALKRQVEHGIYGYGHEPKELRPVILERLQRLYGWRVDPEALIFLPGVVPGFNLACRALVQPGAGLLIQTPVYPPIVTVAERTGLRRCHAELVQQADGRYEIDFDSFERAAAEAAGGLFILCNPHNPVGRVFRRDELERMAEICLRHRLWIVSDEIHCDLLFDGREHLPIATLGPEVAARTVTLMAPSKTFNVAGLYCSVAIVEDPELRARYNDFRTDLIPYVNITGYTAALAGYRDGQPWLEALLAYLESNRDFLTAYVKENLPGVRMLTPEGTYLAWLDCRGTNLGENPHKFFLREARVAVNDGVTFGPGGEGFVRLNFGCPRALLIEGLERMRRALQGRSA